MSCLGNFMPPFGHSTIAFRNASSCVSAHERWSCRMNLNLAGSLPASMQPSRHFSKIISIFSSGAPTVMSPSANMPGLLGGDGPGGRDEDRRRFGRHRPQAGRLELEELALVLDVLAREQLADDLDRLEHPGDPLGRLRPVAGHDVLVERLARPEPEPVAAGVHGGERGRRPGPRSPGATGSSGTSRPGRCRRSCARRWPSSRSRRTRPGPAGAPRAGSGRRPSRPRSRAARPGAE